METLLLKERREWGGHRPEVLNEAPVIANEAEEAAQALCQSWLRLGRQLVVIHGDTGGRDHMAQVGLGCGGEGAFGALHSELVVA